MYNNAKFKCLKSEFEKSEDCLQIPPFGSSIIFDIFSEKDKLLVEVMYNGKAPEICGGQTVCKIRTFIDTIQEKMMDDDFVNLKKRYFYVILRPNNDIMIGSVCVFLVIIGILVMASFGYKKSYQKL